MPPLNSLRCYCSCVCYYSEKKYGGMFTLSMSITISKTRLRYVVMEKLKACFRNDPINVVLS